MPIAQLIILLDALDLAEHIALHTAVDILADRAVLLPLRFVAAVEAGPECFRE